MPENGIRNTYSQSPFQILMYDTIGLISTGSGFFYEINSNHFLITNWHNISGKHFLTKQYLNENGRCPTYIEAKIAIGESGYGFNIIAQKIEIYNDGKPIWYEHPNFGSNCDVIAIKIKRPNSTFVGMHVPSNKISKLRVPVKPGVGAFVIGFPKSLSVGFGIPIWKSGFIASEPFYNVTIGGKVSRFGGMTGGIELPAFFIDTQTREGMSGSPVFANYIGNWNTKNPYEAINPDSPEFSNSTDITIGENRLEFIGCYSSRIGQIEDGAALGLCWKQEAINEICTMKKKGEHPHVNLIE